MEAALENPPVKQDWRARLEMPVLMQEMRSRMRGNRLPVLLFATTACCIATSLLLLMSRWHEVATTSGDPQKIMAKMGHNLFIVLVVFQAVLCALIAPTLTAGSIAGEIKQHTLEMLLL